MSQLKIKNGNNWESIPAGGIGVPSGGTTGQYLKKSSSTDYATEWADVVGYETETIQPGSNYMRLYHNADTGILACSNAYASTAIPSTGVSLPVTPTADAISVCMYFNGSSNVLGFLCVESGKLYVLDNTLAKISANWVSGQVVFPIA